MGYILYVIVSFKVEIKCHLKGQPGKNIKMSQTEIVQPTTVQKTFEEAVKTGDTIKLEKLLEERQGKVNVNWFDTEGQTALHQSCLDGNLDLVKILVRFGADFRLANKDGWSALHIATYGGHQDIAYYLLQLINTECRS